MMTRNAIAVALATALAACATPGENSAARGVETINEPVLSRATFAIDLAAPGGSLAPDEVARLAGWFDSLYLGYGDSIYVDGAYGGEAPAQVADLAARFGLAVLPSAPVTAGAVPPGMVRVVVARNRAEVPNCPNWNQASQPNFKNKMMPNFGCSVNSNLTAMVANPEDLFHGRSSTEATDPRTAAKGVTFYRTAPPTGEKGLQDISTKKDEE